MHMNFNSQDFIRLSTKLMAISAWIIKLNKRLTARLAGRHLLFKHAGRNGLGSSLATHR
jgi:hypothetical protein